MIIKRYLIKLELLKSTKELMKIETLYTTGDLKFLLIEIGVSLLHPNFLCKGIIK